jgi:hypothetical protein
MTVYFQFPRSPELSMLTASVSPVTQRDSSDAKNTAVIRPPPSCCAIPLPATKRYRTFRAGKCHSPGRAFGGHGNNTGVNISGVGILRRQRHRREHHRQHGNSDPARQALTSRPRRRGVSGAPPNAPRAALLAASLEAMIPRGRYLTLKLRALIWVLRRLRVPSVNATLRKPR